MRIHSFDQVLKNREETDNNQHIQFMINEIHTFFYTVTDALKGLFGVYLACALSFDGSSSSFIQAQTSRKAKRNLEQKIQNWETGLVTRYNLYNFINLVETNIDELENDGSLFYQMFDLAVNEHDFGNVGDQWIEFRNNVVQLTNNILGSQHIQCPATNNFVNFIR